MRALNKSLWAGVGVKCGDVRGIIFVPETGRRAGA